VIETVSTSEEKTVEVKTSEPIVTQTETTTVSEIVEEKT